MKNVILFIIVEIFISNSDSELLLTDNVTKSFHGIKDESENQEMNKMLNKRALVGSFPQIYFNRPEPVWKATANLVADGQIEAGPTGVIDFQPIGPNYFIRVAVNVTGFPPGKHAAHIHVFGDISQGCKSTGPHMLNNFIGNVVAKEDGTILSTFSSPFLSIFGFNGILGRSVVIHEKSIDINPNISPIFASPSFSILSEEKEVGPALACGSIYFANNLG